MGCPLVLHLACLQSCGQSWIFAYPGLGASPIIPSGKRHLLRNALLPMGKGLLLSGGCCFPATAAPCPPEVGWLRKIQYKSQHKLLLMCSIKQLQIHKQCFTFGKQSVQQFCPYCRMEFVPEDGETAVFRVSGFEACCFLVCSVSNQEGMGLVLRGEGT